MKLILICLFAFVALPALGYPSHRYEKHIPKHYIGKAAVKGDIVFEGCYEEECHHGQYHGYGCHEGYCRNVCDQKKCWEPEYKAFSGKAKFHGDIVFEGCIEEECVKENYHGYGCNYGKCTHICDQKKCWEPKYVKPEPKYFRGKAKVEADIVFEGCYEEECVKEDYHGYGCHHGECKEVCHHEHCWEPKYVKPEPKYFRGKAKVEADIVFEGCYEEECVKEDYHGYGCHHGECKEICYYDKCWEPKHKKPEAKFSISNPKVTIKSVELTKPKHLKHEEPKIEEYSFPDYKFEDFDLSEYEIDESKPYEFDFPSFE